MNRRRLPARASSTIVIVMVFATMGGIVQGATVGSTFSHNGGTNSELEYGPPAGASTMNETVLVSLRANTTILSASLNLTGRLGFQYSNLTGSNRIQRAYEEYGARVVSIDVSGDSYRDVVVSAPSIQTSGNDAGRLEMFLSSATGLGAAGPAWRYNGTVDGGLGTGLGVGDYNNDGYDDLVANEAGASPRRILLFYGNGTGLPAVPSASLTFAGTGSFCFGCALIGGSDVNGDGFDDLVVGTDAFGVSSGGWVEVYWGAIGGLNVSNVTKIDRSTMAHYGTELFGLGDTDVDGLAEFAVGVRDNGSIEVFEGVSGSRTLAFRWQYNGADGVGIGAAVCDVDGLGAPELLVGAPWNSSNEGRVHVFTGTGAAAYSAAPVASITPLESGAWAYFGQSIACLGDIDANGRDDFVVGAPAERQGAGRAYLYLGGNLTTTFANSIDGSTGVSNPSVGYGWVVHALGDITADGRSDFAVTLHDGYNTFVPSGSVDLNYGTSTPYPENVTLNVGPTTAWTHPARLVGETSLTTFGDEIQAYLAANAGSADAAGFLSVPLDARFDTGGKLRISNLSIRSTVVLAPDPVAVYAPPVGSSLVVAWTPRGLDADTYSVWSNKTGSWQVLANVSKPANSFNDTNVTDGIRYWYRVSEWDGTVPFEGAPSQIATGVPGDLTPPMEPRALQAALDGPGHAVDLSWLANVDDTTTYEVWRSQDGGANYGLVGTVAHPNATFRDTGLVEEQTYWYRVRASDDAALLSTFAPSVQVFMPDLTPPSAPMGLSGATDPSGTAVNLVWSPNTDDTVQYIVMQSPTGAAGSYFEVGRTANTSFQDAGLSRDTRYFYTVIAVDEAGLPSAASAAFSVVTIDSVAPAAPVLLRADPLPEGNSVRLAWSAVGDDLFRFNISREVSGNWVVVGAASPSQREFNVTGLPDGVSVSLRVTAADAGGHESLPSNVLDAVPADTLAPESPVAASATALPTGGAVQLSWEASTSGDVAGYDVYFDAGQSGAWAFLVTLPPAQLGYLQGGLVNGVRYDYEVRAFDEVPNRAPAGPKAFAVPHDIQVPALPILDEAPDLTNHETFFILGSAEPYVDIEVLRGGSVVGVGTADEAGRFNVSVQLVDGPNSLTARAVDRNITVDPQYHEGPITAPIVIGLDRVAPAVTAMSPANGATGVGVGQAIVVTFGEAMDNASFVLSVTDPQGKPVAGALSYDAGTRTLAFAPEQPWARGARYTVIVQARDLAGNAATQGATSFTAEGDGGGVFGIPLYLLVVPLVGVVGGIVLLRMRGRKEN